MAVSRKLWVARDSPSPLLPVFLSLIPTASDAQPHPPWPWPRPQFDYTSWADIP